MGSSYYYGSKHSGLKRQINLSEASLLVVGMVIGSGVFFKPSVVFGNAGAPGLGILAWFVGCFITICGALSIAELGSAIPKTGGLFTYLDELYGKPLAFLYGWVQVIVYYPAMNAALAVVCTTALTSFFKISPAIQKIVSLIILLVILSVNLISTKIGTKFGSITSIIKLIPIFVVIIAGLTMGKSHDFTPFSAPESTLSGFGAAILGALFAYDGWISITALGGELKNPVRDLPKAIVFGLLIVTIAYFGVNLAVINTMPFSNVVASEKAVSDASLILLGDMGASLISIGIVISIVGCLGPFMLTGSRIPYAMAKENMFVAKRLFTALDKNGTPCNALIFQVALAGLYVLTGTYEALTNLLVFITWVFNLIGITGVFVLRKRHRNFAKSNTYRVPGYPFVPILGIAGASYVVLSTLIESTFFAIYGIVVTLIGLPIYYLFIKDVKPIKQLNSH